MLSSGTFINIPSRSLVTLIWHPSRDLEKQQAASVNKRQEKQTHRERVRVFIPYITRVIYFSSASRLARSMLVKKRKNTRGSIRDDRAQGKKRAQGSKWEVLSHRVNPCRNWAGKVDLGLGYYSAWWVMTLVVVGVFLQRRVKTVRIAYTTVCDNTTTAASDSTATESKSMTVQQEQLAAPAATTTTATATNRDLF